MSKALLLGLSALTAAALLAGGAVGRSTSGSIRTLRTATPVSPFAADGFQAGVATTCGPRAFELIAWNPRRRSVVELGREHGRDCYGASTGEGVYELAVAGRRLAWVRYAGGNYQQVWLVTGTVGKPRSTKQLTDQKDHNTGDGVGDWVGNVHGDGSLLVFNTWSVCNQDPEDDLHCPERFPRGYHVYDEDVWRIVGGRKRLILSSDDEATVLAVAAGRILLQRADGSLELRRANGSLLRAFPFRPNEVRGAVLDADELVVLDRSGGSTWRIIDPVSGNQRAIPAAPGAMPQDVERGLLVYTLNRAVHVLRLADRRLKSFRTPVGSYPSAQIEPAGLFYSFQVHDRGRVRFVPLGQIRFGR